MTIVCPSCRAEHQVSVLQRSYRELPCKRCGRPLPLGEPTPQAGLEPLADFEASAPRPRPTVPGAVTPAPGAKPDAGTPAVGTPAAGKPQAALAPHPSILAAMAAASPFSTVATPPAEELPAITVLAPPVSPAVPTTPAAQSDTIACMTCGARYSASIEACPLCEAPRGGKPPAVEGLQCPSCAVRIAVDDRHCRNCGHALRPLAPSGGAWRWAALAALIVLAAAIGYWAVRFLFER